MVSKNYAGAIALTTLLGCSAPSVSSNPENNYVTSELRNQRVKLMYATGPFGGGPTGSAYSPGIPLDSEFVGLAERGLRELHNYTLPQGVFEGRYGMQTDIANSPSLRGSWDCLVIADRSFDPNNFNGSRENVYFTKVVDGKVKFEKLGAK
ncbi:MAG: hypothetical protein ACP5N7_04425 [Candidatus Pacearchaeota archaeon]